MKAINVVAAAALALILTIGCVSNQPPATQTQKTGKALVQRLPAGTEGVELVGDTVRTKPGFHWEKQPNGTVIVKRIAGGGGGGAGVGGTWSCDCDTGPYACEAVIYEGEEALRCQNKRDCLKCVLTVFKKRGSKTPIIAY